MNILPLIREMELLPEDLHAVAISTSQLG